jgi:hypothetical protein
VAKGERLLNEKNSVEFRRSSFCSVGQCVEVGLADGGRVSSGTAESRAERRDIACGLVGFVRDVKASEFDELGA